MSSERVFIDKQSPTVYKAMNGWAAEVTSVTKNAGIDRKLVELVNLRVSQINGCAFCLDLHTHRALGEGESPQRLAVLSAWRETDFFDPVESAALRLAEIVTGLPAHDEIETEYARARDALTDDQISVVLWIATAMNAYNRISILSRYPIAARPTPST